MGPPDWQRRAACQDVPTEQFFPGQEPRHPPAWLVQLCGGCPVRGSCLEVATETRAIGLWAATTTQQRRAASG